ncbi:MAG TPA: hypothetical protein VMR16_02415 [Candidatus Saccharimonadales bacterium]|nr:hypothetical protein [Candidatus Saccharimonadales bacterium]
MNRGLFKSTKKYSAYASLRFKNRSNKRVISNFAKKVGIVYFGYVNQHDDEHKMIRGLTVSPDHQDYNYSVGTVDGYNLSVVDRNDYNVEPDGSTKLNNWVIFAFDLQTEAPVPHFFIGAKNHDLRPFHSLFTTFPNMKEIALETIDDYRQDFTSRFSIFARPAKTDEVLTIISPEISQVISAHFWPLSIEQHDNVLYLYSTFQPVNASLLDTMLKNGLWLASQLDKQTGPVED